MGIRLFVIFSDSIFSCFTCSAVKLQPWVPPRLLFSFTFDIQIHPCYKFHYLTGSKSLWFPAKSSLCYCSGSDLLLLISKPPESVCHIAGQMFFINSKCAIYLFSYFFMKSLFPLPNLLNIVSKIIYRVMIKLFSLWYKWSTLKFMLSPCRTNWR